MVTKPVFAAQNSVNPYGILSQNGTICFAVYIFLAKDLHNPKNSCNFAPANVTTLIRGPQRNQALAVSHGESMEKPIDFWLRTEGTAGSVVPTIDSLEDLNESGTKSKDSVRVRK